MNISESIQNKLGPALLTLKHHSPTILTGVGVAALLTAGVLAAKNTLKLERAVDDARVRLDDVNAAIGEQMATPRDRTKVYARNVYEVAKLYIVPGGLAVGGVICVLGAHNIVTKRNVGLAAAYNTLAASFDSYRERVREEIGEERESDLYHNLKTEERTIDGKKTLVKIPADGEHAGSPYRFYFDMQNENWSGFHLDNLHRLQLAQSMFNQRLQSRGWVILSDVLVTLGIQPTEASFVVGWIKDPDTSDGVNRDNFVEFNIRDYQEEYGYFLLDFNVQGTVFDKINK